MNTVENIIISAAQATPVYLDRAATTDKACDLIASAARKGAKLIVFPEAFVPCYPDWIWVIPPNQNKLLADLYGRLVDQSLTIDSAETEKICRVARQSDIHVVLGVNERNSDASGSSLYNTILYISHEGTLLGKHRKLVPTAPERMIWAQGDGSTLEVYESPFGKLGGLICWENYMPLARHTMFAQYRAAFPDFQFTTNHILAEGDWVCARFTFKGTNKGPMMGSPATGKSVSVDGYDLIRITDGKMVEHYGVFDYAGMLTQLGMMPGARSATPQEKKTIADHSLDRQT